MRKILSLLIVLPLLSYGQYGVPRKFSQIPVSTVPAVGTSDYFVGTHNNGDGTFTDYLYQPSSSIVDTVTSTILGVTYSALDSGLATRIPWNDTVGGSAINPVIATKFGLSILANDIDTANYRIDSVAGLSGGATLNSVMVANPNTNQTYNWGPGVGTTPYANSIGVNCGEQMGYEYFVDTGTGGGHGATYWQAGRVACGSAGQPYSGATGFIAHMNHNGVEGYNSDGLGYLIAYDSVNELVFECLAGTAGFLKSQANAGPNAGGTIIFKFPLVTSTTTAADTVSKLGGVMLTAADIIGQGTYIGRDANGIAGGHQLVDSSHLATTITYSNDTFFTPTTTATVNAQPQMYNIIAPSGTIAALTISLPSSPINNETVVLKFSQIVTSLTFTNGTVGPSYTAGTNGGLIWLVFHNADSKWY